MDYHTGRLFLPASRIFAAGFTHGAINDGNIRVGDCDLEGSPVQLVHRTLNEPFLRATYYIYCMYLDGIGSGAGSVEWSTSTRHAPGQQMRLATISQRVVRRTGDSLPFRFLFTRSRLVRKLDRRNLRWISSILSSTWRIESNSFIANSDEIEESCDNQETTNFVSCFEKYHSSLAIGQTHE